MKNKAYNIVSVVGLPSLWAVKKICILIGIVVCATLLLLGVVSAGDRLSFSDSLIKVESLREAAKTINLCKDHQLVLEIQAQNSYIRSTKYANSVWYYDWIVSDKWNSVEEIKLPE